VVENPGKCVTLTYFVLIELKLTFWGDCFVDKRIVREE